MERIEINDNPFAEFRQRLSQVVTDWEIVPLDREGYILVKLPPGAIDPDSGKPTEYLSHHGLPIAWPPDFNIPVNPAWGNRPVERVPLLGSGITEVYKIDHKGTLTAARLAG